MSGHSRRSLLTRGVVLAAGAVGLTAGGADAAQGPRSLRLYGVNWRLTTPTRAPGEAIQLGDQSAVYGDLLDGPAGKAIGRFFGSRLAVQSTTGGHARADASVEVHTFVLDGGTIVGMGTPVLGRAVFAIVGGTGEFAGASGSYAAHQRLREQGGNGTAHFDLTLRS
jgi:hypothetical protein